MVRSTSPFAAMAFASIIVLVGVADSLAQSTKDAATPRQTLLVHYMPWFVAKPHSQVWGWHWTMNAFNPERHTDGRQELASHFRPSIGAYDSGDPAVIEYHLLTMKIAGIDGVIVDWYGRTDFRDYALLHRHTLALFEQVERLGMKFVVCYEDQSIPALVEAKRIAADSRVSHAAAELDWLKRNWWNRDAYLRFEEKPILLSFGQNGLSDREWSECLKSVASPVAYFSLHHRRSMATGAFDWPLPSEGMKAISRFENAAEAWPASIPVAFPRFVDIYVEAKVHASYGRVEDDRGETFQRTFLRAVKSRSPLVQIATWNDWGEGTIIEPSVEFGYRDLEVIQAWRQRQEPSTKASRFDLQLPRRLYERRKNDRGTATQSICDKAAQLLRESRYDEARKVLE